MRLVVGITGATGTVIGVRILQALRALDVETHLVISRWGRATLENETDLKAADVQALAGRAYASHDQFAEISSGSFPTDGMVIAPPVPAFYNRPATVEDIITHIVVRVLDQFGLDVPEARRWAGRVPREPVAPPAAPGDP